MKKLCIALVAVSLLVAGCGKPEDKFIGSYKGSIEFDESSMEQLRTMAKSMGQDPSKLEEELNSLQPSLELKADGVCTISVKTSNGSSSVNAKWTLAEDGSTVTLHDPEMSQEDKDQAVTMGVKDLENQVFTVSEDGKTLSYTNSAMGMTAVTKFTRI